MKFIEQIEFILQKIGREINRIINRIKSYFLFGSVATIVVIAITILLILRFGKDISGLVGSLIGLSSAIILNFIFSIFKENMTAKEKLKELDEKKSDFQNFKNSENDEMIKKLVETAFLKYSQ